MPRALIRSKNKRWFCTDKRWPAHETERGALVTTIAFVPGISTTQLLDAQPDKVLRKRIPSRLTELEREGYLRSEFIADLFS